MMSNETVDQEQPAWMQNDKLFLQQLALGRRYQGLVALRLAALGCGVEIAPLRVRGDVKDRHAYSDSGDLFVSNAAGVRVTVEVKSRDRAFTCPADYEWDDILVRADKPWNGDIPAAHFFISQVTESILVVADTSRPQWIRREIYDQKRGIKYAAFYCPRARIGTVLQWVKWFKART